MDRKKNFRAFLISGFREYWFLILFSFILPIGSAEPLQCRNICQNGDQPDRQFKNHRMDQSAESQKNNPLGALGHTRV